MTSTSRSRPSVPTLPTACSLFLGCSVQGGRDARSQRPWLKSSQGCWARLCTLYPKAPGTWGSVPSRVSPGQSSPQSSVRARGRPGQGPAVPQLCELGQVMATFQSLGFLACKMRVMVTFILRTWLVRVSDMWDRTVLWELQRLWPIRGGSPQGSRWPHPDLRACQSPGLLLSCDLAGLRGPPPNPLISPSRSLLRWLFNFLLLIDFF